MKKIKIITEEKPIDINDIQEVEKFGNFNFPESYVDFLLSVNGGVMVPSTINLNLSNPIYIDFLYSIGDIILDLKIRNDSFLMIKELFEDGEFDIEPELLIPIAITQRGGYLFINCNKDDNYGSIYYANFYGFGDIIKTDFSSIDDVLSSSIFEDDVDYEEYINKFVAKRLFQFQRSKYDDKYEKLYFKRFKELLDYQTDVEIKHPFHGNLLEFYLDNPTLYNHIIERKGG